MNNGQRSGVGENSLNSLTTVCDESELLYDIDVYRIVSKYVHAKSRNETFNLCFLDLE